VLAEAETEKPFSYLNVALARFNGSRGLRNIRRLSALLLGWYPRSAGRMQAKSEMVVSGLAVGCGVEEHAEALARGRLAGSRKKIDEA